MAGLHLMQSNITLLPCVAPHNRHVPKVLKETAASCRISAISLSRLGRIST